MGNYQFNLTVDQNIQTLSEELLNEEEIKLLDNIAETLLNEEKKEYAVKQMQELIGSRPKRPIYYLNNEIDALPEETRDVVRYAGDYIDQLIKHCTHEKARLGFIAYQRSLGANLKRLNKLLSSSLLSALSKYNNLIYVRAKHSWDVGSRPHLFSCKDAVIVCFITKKLAGHIIDISAEAKMYSEDKLFRYYSNSSGGR